MRTRQDARVELPQRYRLLVLHLGIGHLAVPQRVVHRNQATNAHLQRMSSQTPFRASNALSCVAHQLHGAVEVVAVGAFVGVDEAEVEGIRCSFVSKHRVQRLHRATQPRVHLPVQKVNVTPRPNERERRRAARALCATPAAAHVVRATAIVSAFMSQVTSVPSAGSASAMAVDE